MLLVSTCPLPVGSILWQTWSGATVLSVVCKATFLLRAVQCPLAEVQDPVLDADRYLHDDPRAELLAPTDLVPFKRRAEVIVVGHARAASGATVHSLRAELRVAGISKALEIFPDRVVTYDGRLRLSPPFTKAPLLWKLAAGGPRTSNPVGVALDAPWDVYGQRLLPRIQPPGLHVTGPADVIPTVGFGPIAPTWPERLEKLHRHAVGWDHARWHLRPLPQDIGVAYFNAAPADQQVDEIRADERIALENLHPLFAHLATNLTPVRPVARVERPGRASEVAPFLCDTMWIDADRGTCTLSWRTRIPLTSRDEAGQVVVSLADELPSTAGVIAAPTAAAVPSRGAAPVQAASAPAPAPAAMAAAAPSPAAPADPRSLERCAAIAASCARRPGDTVAILADHGLTEDAWDELEQRWAETIRRDAEHGFGQLQGAYDRAYVLCLEQERGPITPVEYARLSLAQSRDRAALPRALREMELPWGCAARIRRVYEERMAGDPQLAEAVSAAMSEA
jgi:hypothetical protein